MKSAASILDRIAAAGLISIPSHQHGRACRHLREELNRVVAEARREERERCARLLSAAVAFDADLSTDCDGGTRDELRAALRALT